MKINQIVATSLAFVVSLVPARTPAQSTRPSDPSQLGDAPVTQLERPSSPTELQPAPAPVPLQTLQPAQAAPAIRPDNTAACQQNQTAQNSVRNNLEGVRITSEYISRLGGKPIDAEQAAITILNNQLDQLAKQASALDCPSR